MGKTIWRRVFLFWKLCVPLHFPIFYIKYSMRKSVKIILFVAGAVVGLVLLISALVAPVAKWFVEKHDVDIIGREVTIDNLKANIFNGKVEIDGFTASEDDANQQFLAFDTLAVQIRLMKLLKHEVVLNYIHLTGLDGNVVMGQDGLNFMSIVRRFQKDEPKKEKKNKWVVELYDIVLKRGAVTYADTQRGSSWRLDGLKLDVPGLTFGKDTTNAGLAFNFTDGGRLVTKAKYNSQSNRYALDLTLERVNMGMAMPFVRDYLAISEAEGLLSGQLLVDGSLSSPTDIDVSGPLKIESFHSTLADGTPLLAFQQLDVKVDNVNPSKRNYHLSEALLTSPEVTFDRYKNGTTFSRLLKSDSVEASEPVQEETAVKTDKKGKKTKATKEKKRNKKSNKSSAEPEDTPLHIEETMVADNSETTADNTPIHLLIDEAKIVSGSVHFSDHTLFSPFTYPLNNLQAEAKNFTLDNQNDIRLSAQLPKGGSVMASWKGGLNFSKTDQSLVLVIKNMAMAQVSPYVEYFTGNSLEGGVLSFSSENTIKGGMLKGTNVIDIYQCLVGKKNKELNAEYANIPVKLGVSLLQDLDHKFKFNVPVSGDINSPKFSYGKIVWQAIANIMLKAVASPFVAIARAAGVNGSELKAIEVDPLQPDFTSKQYDAFSRIVNVMRAAPDSTVLVLTQQFSMDDAVNSMGVFAFKRGLYYQQHPERNGAPFSLSDWQGMTEIKDNNPALINYSDAQTKTKGKTMKQKVAMNFSTDTLQRQVDIMAALRNRQLTDYLVNKMGLKAESVVVRTLDAAELKNYKGRPSYEVELQLPKSAALPPMEEDE